MYIYLTKIHKILDYHFCTFPYGCHIPIKQLPITLPLPVKSLISLVIRKILIKTVTKLLPYTHKDDYNVKEIIPNVDEKVKQLCPSRIERINCGILYIQTTILAME